MFLSDDELAKLTGRPQKSKQIEWLRANGWRFAVRATGHPLVAISEAQRHLVGGATRAPAQPNWSALDGA
jgi:hypothetical protein